MKKNVHVIAHSHWDREWYMPFEYHRARLVRLIDDCMELFETDEDFKSFHIIASHSDSPTFKIKENPELEAEGWYGRLNVEKYGDQ